MKKYVALMGLLGCGSAALWCGAVPETLTKGFTNDNVGKALASQVGGARNILAGVYYFMVGPVGKMTVIFMLVTAAIAFAVHTNTDQFKKSSMAILVGSLVISFIGAFLNLVEMFKAENIFNNVLFF